MTCRSCGKLISRVYSSDMMLRNAYGTCLQVNIRIDYSYYDYIYYYLLDNRIMPVPLAQYHHLIQPEIKQLVFVENKKIP